MKILIVGNGNSRFIRDYIRNIKQRLQEEHYFDLFTTELPLKDPQEPGLRQILSFPSLFLGIKKIKIFLRTIFLARIFLLHSKEYDIIHFHYAMPELIILNRFLRNFKGKLVITVFGSDFLRINHKRKISLKPAFERADVVTFANEETEKYFLQFYNFDKNKTKICRFGLEPLEKIISDPDKVYYRTRIDLPIEKIIIVIAYNYEKNQQHLKVLKELNKFPTNIRVQIHLVFPMTYGSDPKYRDSVIQQLDHSGFSYTAYTKYLSEDDNAALKMASDIMIHLPLADQFSGAMQEHLCAGNIVITGEWLPYRYFEERGVYFFRINTIEDLLPRLSHCIDHLQEEKKKCTHNYDIIQSISNWNSTSRGWIDLYNNLSK